MKLAVVSAAFAGLVLFAAPSYAAVTIIASAPGVQGQPGASFEGLGNGPLPQPYSEAGIDFTTGGTVLVQNFSDGNGAYPFGLQPAGSNYVSVTGGSQLDATFSGLTNRVGFYWGSVDTYNTVQLYNGNTLVGTLTGDQVTPTLQNNGGQSGFESNRYVTLLSTDAFDRAVFTSGSNSFEIDNISSGVPEPSTWMMMLLGFAGLAFAYGRSNRASTAIA